MVDIVSAGKHAEDINSQTETETENYVNDAIGNLVEDKSEGLEISWNVYGKISQIEKSAGNMVSKSYDGKTTIYVRDASGNTLTDDAFINADVVRQISAWTGFARRSVSSPFSSARVG